MKSSNDTILVTGGSGFIGTNMIEYLSHRNVAIVNLDKNPPKVSEQTKYWRKCDILDDKDVLSAFKELCPGYVVHLAAETNVDGKSLSYYRPNIEGISNVLNAANATRSIKQILVASTQHVHQFRGIPKHDQDYRPLGLYGESKVLTERITRSAKLECNWCIIRPTNIWGPWHNIYPQGLWKQMLAGRYLHPGRKTVIRSYGFVGNVVHQIAKLLAAEPSLTNEKVFYVGDEPIDLYDWVNAFSLELTARNVRVVPRFVMRGLAYVGDLCSLINVEFPMTSRRYANMTIDNPCDMKRTFQITGSNPFDLVSGVKATVEWYSKIYSKMNQEFIENHSLR